MKHKLPNTKAATPSLPTAFEGEIFQNVGKYARGAVLYAFEKVGGADGLSDWAESNKDEFYTKLFPKIITRESEVTHHKTVDQLMDVLDGDYVVDGEFDEVPDITDQLPPNVGQGEVYPTPISAPVYAEAYESPNYAEAYDGEDLVDFEE